VPALLLRRRRTDLVELMDRPDCDPAALENTYRHFRKLNRMIAGWRRIYVRVIRPRLKEGPATLVDIGCGGADVPAYLTSLAERDGLDLTATGIDPDPRAIRHARRNTSLEILQSDSGSLAMSGRGFDFVISNHVMHHLDQEALTDLFRDSERLAGCAAIHNDILRDDMGLAGFSLLGLAFPGSFIRPDGLMSIRRSYTRAELRDRLPEGWRAESLVPYRLLAVLQK
jgi:2-polyprenyl-3-methyl-5-hydroxy-6-metoxy-1,4-benzoquinol methylase